MGVGGWEARAARGWRLISKNTAPAIPLGIPPLGIGKGSPAIVFPLRRHYVTIEWYAIKYYSPEATMSAITATEARKNLFGLIQQVNDDHTVVEVVSRHGNAVIVSKDDYDAMTETAYLLRNPANAERLLAAIDRARRGEFQEHDLLDA